MKKEKRKVKTPKHQLGSWQLQAQSQSHLLCSALLIPDLHNSSISLSLPTNQDGGEGNSGTIVFEAST
ncbi:hypothetical protein GQ457_18G001860 [Hibiscus cannabinus]